MCQGRWTSTVGDLTLPQLSSLQLVTVPVLVPWGLGAVLGRHLARHTAGYHSPGSPSTALEN